MNATTLKELQATAEALFPMNPKAQHEYILRGLYNGSYKPKLSAYPGSRGHNGEAVGITIADLNKYSKSA